MTYWWLHYHLIWRTFERQPSITPEREKMIYGVLYRKADELGLKIHAAGNAITFKHLPEGFILEICVPFVDKMGTIPY